MEIGNELPTIKTIYLHPQITIGITTNLLSK